MGRNRTTVLKVQRSLSSNMLMVTSRDYSVYETRVPLTEHVRRFIGDRYKTYVRGYVRDGYLRVECVVDDQTW